MRKKDTIRIVMLALILAGAFILSRSATLADRKNAGKESIDQCCKKKNATDPGKTTWENLSGQFFSSI